jgi:hypothetical protein
MMAKGKYLIIITISIMTMLALSTTVSAETESDPQGDVWHFIYPYWNQQTISDKPNVDIKEIKAEVSGDQITLSIVLWPGGTFSRGDYEHVAYVMFFNTSDAFYMMSYADSIGQVATGSALGMSLDMNGTYLPSAGDAIVTDNVLSATLNKAGDDTTSMEFWGTAYMYEHYGAEQYLNDAWFDWVGDYDWDPELESDDGTDDEDSDDEEPDEGADDEDEGTNGEDSTNGDGSSSSSSPGFELILLIAAFAIIVIIYRKKK